MEEVGGLGSGRSRRRCDASDLRAGGRRFVRVTKQPCVNVLPLKQKRIAIRMRVLGVVSLALVFLILFAAQFSSSGRRVVYSLSDFGAQTYNKNTSSQTQNHATMGRGRLNARSMVPEDPDEALAGEQDTERASWRDVPAAKFADLPYSSNSSLGWNYSKITYAETLKMEEEDHSPRYKVDLYYREDLMGGFRPVCRIHGACLLSNGIYSLPKWMRTHRSELSRCGLAVTFRYHDTPSDLPYRKDIDADFVHTHQTLKFKEPPSHFAHFFPEVVMKASFLFEMLDSQTREGVPITYCRIVEEGKDCISAKESSRTKFKPALFVPLNIQRSPESWSSHALSLLGNAYGELTSLSMRDVLHSGFAEQPQNLSSTCFRSVVASFPVYRDFPAVVFAGENRFFKKNGIDRSSDPISNNKQSQGSSPCTVSAGILDRDGQRVMADPEGLRRMIGHVVKATQAPIEVDADIFKFDPSVSFDQQVHRMQTTDILVAAHGAALANIGFMKEERTVVEIFPFGWRPTIFAQMAHVFGIKYHSVSSIPQSKTFKDCLTRARMLMVRKGIIQRGEDPPWLSRALQEWDEAVSEHLESGNEIISFVGKESSLSNFYTRSCARHQSLEFDNLEVARLVAQSALNLCGNQKTI